MATSAGGVVGGWRRLSARAWPTRPAADESGLSLIPIGLLLIKGTIILAVADYLAGFYEETYTSDARTALRGERWRALSAVGKAEHAIALCRRAGITPKSTLEVGCGDGAVLCELRRHAFGGRLEGMEIAQAAVQIARTRSEIDAVGLYAGEDPPLPDDARDLGILSPVLEPVHHPPGLLREVARVC